VIVVDTTVLVYAVGDEHPLLEPSRRLVRAVAGGAIRATTTVEVIQEFAHVRARRRPRSDAASLARDFAETFAPLLVVDRSALEEGLALFETHDTLNCFDAVLAAAALAGDAGALVSADTGFADVPGLNHVALGAEAFERLVRADAEG
jgi:predicted nucleic acid-binding protein